MLAPCVGPAPPPSPAARGCRCPRCRSRCRLRRPARASRRESPRAGRAARGECLARAPGDRRRDRRRAGPARCARRLRRAELDASTSVTSRTFAANACARAAHAGSSAKQLAVFLHRRSAAGGVDDDDVDAGALEMCRSARARRRARPRRGRRAARARRSSPATGGATTSQPSAASTRTVASFTSPKNARCTQPVSSPTRQPRSHRSARRVFGDSAAQRASPRRQARARSDCAACVAAATARRSARAAH